MSTIDVAIEKVRHLDDAHARQLLAWLEAQERTEKHQPMPFAPVAPLGAMAMLGFARQFHPQARTTRQWMVELRAGEND